MLSVVDEPGERGDADADAPAEVRPPSPADVPRPWVSAWPPGVPTGWSYPDVPVGRLVDDAARDVPDGPALVSGSHRLTWAQLAGVVDEVARGLSTLEPERIVLDCHRGLDAMVVALAAWRLGALLEVADPTTSAPVEPTPTDRRTVVVVATPRRVPARDRGVGQRLPPVIHLRPRRTIGSADRERDAVVVADVARLVHRRTRRLRLPLAGGRLPIQGLVRRLRGASLGARLSDLVDEAGQARLPPVDPDSPALRLTIGGTVRTATQRQLVAATFQVRLWIPDVATGTEVVAASVGWWRPGGLVVGLLLATLAAGTCQVADAGLATTAIPGATLAFARPETWRQLAGGPAWRRALSHRRARSTVTELRLAGALVGPGDGRLDEASTARLVRATEGARVRHFWQPDETVGPLLAQPVYGRLAGDPGAVPLGDTVLTVHRGTTLAHGPQVPLSGPDGWTPITMVLPLDVVTGRVTAPGHPGPGQGHSETRPLRANGAATDGSSEPAARDEPADAPRDEPRHEPQEP